MAFIKKNRFAIILLLSSAVLLLFGIGGGFYEGLFDFDYIGRLFKNDIAGLNTWLGTNFSTVGIAMFHVFKLVIFFMALIAIVVAVLNLFGIANKGKLTKFILLVQILMIVSIAIISFADATFGKMVEIPDVIWKMTGVNWAWWVMLCLSVILLLISCLKVKSGKKSKKSKR